MIVEIIESYCIDSFLWYLFIVVMVTYRCKLIFFIRKIDFIKDNNKEENI